MDEYLKEIELYENDEWIKNETRILMKLEKEEIIKKLLDERYFMIFKNIELLKLKSKFYEDTL